MNRFRLRPPKQPRLVENDVERACLDLLRAHRWWPLRIPAGLYKSPDDKRWIKLAEAGVPDYAVLIAPSFLMEVKRPGGKLSDVQRAKIRELEICYRLPVVVVDHVEFLREWLEEHERKFNLK